MGKLDIHPEQHFPGGGISDSTSEKSVQSNLAKGRIANLSPPRLRMDSSDLDLRLQSTRVSPPNGISIGSAVSPSTSV